MKKLLTIMLLSCVPYLNYCQEVSDLELKALFTAVIVENMDTSIVWYSKILGFEVLNKIDMMEERGFKQSNLKKGETLLELIELSRAVNPQEAIPDYNSKTRLQGFFKIGFRVINFQSWMDHFNNSKIDFYGGIVNDPISGKQMVIITDPDGNRIQIFEK
ncbi:VOC family protein [Ekhidna sp.]